MLNRDENGFSEEVLNAYLTLSNERVHKNQEHTYIFDTVATSVILANILNHERVQAIFNKKNVNLNYYRYLLFPVIDISSASVQMLQVDTFTFTITVYQPDAPSKLGDMPGEFFKGLFNVLHPAYSVQDLDQPREQGAENDKEWSVKYVNKVGEQQLPLNISHK